jgi:hypothetical protein
MGGCHASRHKKTTRLIGKGAHQFDLPQPRSGAFNAKQTPSQPVSAAAHFGRPRHGHWRAEWLGALNFRVRRTVLMTKLLYSIGTGLQLQVDVRISDFVAWRAVSHDQKGCIIVGRIQEVMTIASACRECDAGAWPDRLASRIGDEDEFTLDDVNELILFRVGVPSRRLAARLDTYEVDAVVLEPTVIAETPVPTFALGVTKWRRIAG